MFKIIQFISFGNRVAILWLLNCIFLSLSLVMGLDVDLTVSVPEFTYSLCFK